MGREAENSELPKVYFVWFSQETKYLDYAEFLFAVICVPTEIN